MAQEYRSHRSAMHRRFTASCIILFILFSGYRNENFEQTGLLGKSVTLQSGVNKPGNLARIEWSIFNNDSYIAVFYGGQPQYFRQQSKRLKLNITSGDLEIMDLHREDSGTYTVHVRNTEGGRWDNKVTLSVQERLPVPKITVINSTVQVGICKIFLTCSVKSESTVTITYGPEGFPHGCEFKPLRYVTTGREAEAWCSPTQDVNITCTASDSVSTTASTVTTGCSAPPVGFSPCLLKMVVFSVGLIIMVSAVITVHLRKRFYRQREHVQGAETEGTAPLGGRL